MKCRTKQPTTNATSARKSSHLLRVDPTLTATLRRQMTLLFTQGFGGLAKAMRKRTTVLNCNPGQLRGADGRCGHGIGIGIDRDEMPQVKGDDLGAFVTWVNFQRIGIALRYLRADSLQPVQSEFRQERVDSMPDDPGDITPILSSRDGRVLDGTHRWLKVRQRDPAGEVRSLVIDLDVEDAIALMRRFPGVRYTENAAQKGSGPVWLAREMAKVGNPSQAVIKSFLAKARAKGAKRAFDDVRRLEAKSPMSDKVWAESDVYEGPRASFLSGVARRSNKDVAEQAKEVRGIVKKNVRRTADNLASPDSVEQVLESARYRMRRIADTELVRQHAEGQLDVYERMGVAEVGVVAEWLTSGHPCPECSVHSGKAYTIEQARGMIPAHPGCRCVWSVGLRKGGWRTPTRNAFLGLFSKGKATEAKGGNCGVGAGGFLPGNTCGKGGAETAPEGKGAGATHWAKIHSPEFKRWFGDWEHDPAHASKVVDHEGKPAETAHVAGIASPPPAPSMIEHEAPKVVYHGSTHGEFEEFRKDKIANPDSLHYGPGFYFTEDVHAAHEFAKGAAGGTGGKPAVMSYFLKVTNPFDADRDKIDPSKLPEKERRIIREAVILQGYADGPQGARDAASEFDSGLRMMRYEELTSKAGVGGYGVAKSVVAEHLKSLGHDGITTLAPDGGGGAGKNRFWIVFPDNATNIKSTKATKFDERDPITTHAEEGMDNGDEELFGLSVENEDDEEEELIGLLPEVEEALTNANPYHDAKGRFAKAGAKGATVSKSHAVKEVTKQLKAEPHTAPPPGSKDRPVHDPDVEAKGKDGITKAAKVGVDAMSVPPPPKIGRLPNLTPRERAVESHFINHFESNPDKVAHEFLQSVLAKTKIGQAPTFGTDDAKELNHEWTHESLSLEERSKNRATLNLALHQTANAIAKRAFVQHLDTLRKGDEVLVTVGGCGAGKGFALGADRETGVPFVPEAFAMKQRAKAVWDSAGDQNATENKWIQKEAGQRGLKVNYVYVDADPYKQWADPTMGVVKRAQDPKDGRMVDAKVFADSYVLGAGNFHAFHQANKDNPDATFTFLRNRAGETPSKIAGVPKEALAINRKALAGKAIREVLESDAPDHVKRGAIQGIRVWPDDKV